MFLCYNKIMKNFNVVVENIDHFARGIAKINGKVVFISNALIGEELLIKITKENKNIMEGEVISYINKSKNRINPICPYYDKCGGCDLMHMNNKLLFKENKVKEILKKFADFDNVKPIVSVNEINYRNKVTLQVNKKIGYFKKKTNEIISIDSCLLADNRINRVINDLQFIDTKSVKRIVIRTSKDEMMLVFYSDNDISIDINKFNYVSTIINISFTKRILKGKGYIIDEVNNFKYKISPTSFYQVNKECMIKLYDKVLEYCGEDIDNLLDLYCGTGTIGIYLSKHCKNVLGIEINEEAVKDAFYNKEINNITNINFIDGDVGKILNNNFIFDVVVLDPPRAGLDNNTIKYLISVKPKKIVYVSCDPVTLARDINILKKYYDILEITPFDMFPNTYHVECVCSLKLK